MGEKKSIAIIPARGGSKRIPRKNIKSFLGKPIIQYSIDVALKSNLFDEVMVSTDDEEIAKIAKSFSARVPFLRNKLTSNDVAGLSSVVLEVLDAYENLDKSFKYFCCILPTAPFITTNKLKEAFNIMTGQQFDAVFPITRFGYPIQRSLNINDNKVNMIYPENYEKKSQDFTPSYHDSGQFYWMRVDEFKKQKRFFVKNSGAIILSEIESQDIDTKEDWAIAECKYQFLMNHKNTNV